MPGVMADCSVFTHGIYYKLVVLEERFQIASRVLCFLEISSLKRRINNIIIFDDLGIK